MLSMVGSPLHAVTSALFFTFLVMSLMEGPRAQAMSRPLPAAITALMARPTCQSFVFVSMTKCVKPLRYLATSSTKSSKWSVLIGRAGTKSD